MNMGGRALDELGGGTPTELNQTPNAHILVAVGLREISFESRGKQPRSSAKVPKSRLSGKEVELRRQPGGWLRSSHP